MRQTLCGMCWRCEDALSTAQSAPNRQNLKTGSLSFCVYRRCVLFWKLFGEALQLLLAAHFLTGRCLFTAGLWVSINYDFLLDRRQNESDLLLWKFLVVSFVISEAFLRQLKPTIFRFSLRFLLCCWNRRFGTLQSQIWSLLQSSNRLGHCSRKSTGAEFCENYRISAPKLEQLGFFRGTLIYWILILVSGNETAEFHECLNAQLRRLVATRY